MSKSHSNRLIPTPSSYARTHYLYVQEVGTLHSLEPHISSRRDLNSYLFFVVLSGSGTVSYEGGLSSLEAGDCVWLDCNKPYSHESSASDPWSLSWVHFHGPQAREFYDSFLWHGNSYLFHPAGIVSFTDALESIYRVHEEKPALMELRAHKHLTDLVTLCHTEGGRAAGGESTIPDKIKQIHSFLEEHYADRIRLDQLAEQFYISKYHLSREYKKVYGATLGNDLTAKRLSHAKTMLRFTDASVEAVAAACGFQNAGYFIRVFKKAENMTPLEYRKRW